MLLLIGFPDSILVEVSLEHASEDTAQESGTNVGSLVEKRCLWGCWVDPSIHDSLENWLNDADGWVDATAGDTTSDLEAGVESEANSSSVEWHISGSVMLHDLDHEGHEEECHNELNPEHLSGHLAIIVAAIMGAQLLQVVSTFWDLVAALGAQWETHEADSTANHGSDGLSNNDKQRVEEGRSAQVMSVFNEDGNGDGRIKVASTDWSKDLSHCEEGQTNTHWCVLRGATPVKSSSEHCCTEKLRDEHPSLVFTSAWNFHFVVAVKLLIIIDGDFISI